MLKIDPKYVVSKTWKKLLKPGKNLEKASGNPVYKNKFEQQKKQLKLKSLTYFEKLVYLSFILTPTN